MNLFRKGDFTLASGAKSTFKIEADALTKEDWDGVAEMARRIIPAFGRVIPVPRGGIPFAEALEPYANRFSRRIVIVDDVLTTGGSIAKVRKEVVGAGASPDFIIGIVLFARGPLPEGVIAIFSTPTYLWLSPLPPNQSSGCGS